MKQFFTKLYDRLKQHKEHMTLKHILTGLGICVIALLIFQAGMIVGVRKAHFARSWSDHYFENFGPRNHSPAGPMPGQFPNAHGTIGQIISVNGSTMIVADHGKTEKVVMISDDTRIRSMDRDETMADLTPDTSVVVVGEPNDQGQIIAKFIRIIPAPPTDVTTPTNQ